MSRLQKRTHDRRFRVPRGRRGGRVSWTRRASAQPQLVHTIPMMIIIVSFNGHDWPLLLLRPDCAGGRSEGRGHYI